MKLSTVVMLLHSASRALHVPRKRRAAQGSGSAHTEQLLYEKDHDSPELPELEKKLLSTTFTFCETPQTRPRRKHAF